NNLRLRRSAVAARPGRALRYAKGFARGLLHHPVGHYLLPGEVLERRLFWQINRLASDQLQEMTRSILSVARRELARE
ncbi:hypothetical protein V8352_20680, partial [Roseovarius sp. D0-M9]